MTLKKRYDEVMDRIEVTEEMRRRILHNIQDMEIRTAPERGRLRFLSLKGYLSAAACLVLLLAGAVILPRLMYREAPDPPVQAIPQIEAVSSLQELSDLVGFEVTEEFALPFAAENISYVSYWNELAEVDYSGEGGSAAFRKSVGTSDNSGDYTAYSAAAEIAANGWTITLKGEGDAYLLAVWTDGAFSYSLRLSQAISKEAWQTVFGA